MAELTLSWTLTLGIYVGLTWCLNGFVLNFDDHFPLILTWGVAWISGAFAAWRFYR